MWRKGVGVLAGLVLLLAASRLPAALWRAADLFALVSVSDAIVLAENVGTRTVTDSRGNPITLTRYRLKKVFKGPVLPAEVIELRDWYRREPFALGRQKKFEYDKDAIIFLSRFDPHRLSALRSIGAADRPRFSITHSGLRLLAKGKVYTFVQHMNPGPAYPTPLLRGQDFFSGEGHVTLDEFEGDIRRALLRLETLRYARQLSDAGGRRATLLGLLRPYRAEAKRREPYSPPGRPGMFFVQQIIEILNGSGDIEGALEAIHVWPWGARFDRDTAIKAATNAAYPPIFRAAAIGAIESLNLRDRQTIETLEKFLEAEQPPIVRAAASQRLWDTYRVYEVNTHRHEPELTSLWKRVLERPGPGLKSSRRKE